MWAFGYLTTLLLYAWKNPYLFYKLGFCLLIFGERDDEEYPIGLIADMIASIMMLLNYIQFNWV